jgi:glucose/arabinose dehydrogenase/N-acetylneuraminic acid mutarotase
VKIAPTHKSGRRLYAIVVGLAAAFALLPLSAQGQTAPTYELLVSQSADRSNAVPLDGATFGGKVAIFTRPDTSNIKQVVFYRDDPTLTTPLRTEKGAPYDFNGTASNGNANLYDLAGLANGTHNVTAVITFTDNSKITLSANFTVDKNTLAFAPNSVSEKVAVDSVETENVDLSSSLSPTPFTVTDNASWLTVSPSSGTTPTQLTLTFDTTGLPIGGPLSATVTATGANHLKATLPVSLTVANEGGCFPLACSLAKVSPPYELTFGEDAGMILDKDNEGTGFTWIDQPTATSASGTGYLPSNVDVDIGNDVLRLTSTAGSMSESTNSQDNALGVGFDAPSQVTVLTTTILDIQQGTGNFEQAGLWFGTDDNNYVKLVVISNKVRQADGTTIIATQIEFGKEVDGAYTKVRRTSALDLVGASVTLALKATPQDQSVSASYSIGDGLQTSNGKTVVPSELFSFDAAGINPEIGTRSFGGIFATHRKGPSPVVFTFGSFSMTKAASAAPPSVPTSEGISFKRMPGIPVGNPTSMAWGPDDRLYVATLLGKIHALRFGPNKELVSSQLIETIGKRLTLGLTVDPLSTPDNVVLWVSHSSPSLSDGVPNSGVLSRLSGAGFATRVDVVTGLPRAKANHGTNSLHFGPDGKLYIAQGGNTGAGAPNNLNTEFGTMQEQPLSAALLVADVRNPSFDGSCNNETDMFGPPPCDVQVYASGLRNMYDFVFHSNGQIYGPDNGLGVDGTFPPTPTPPCFGNGTEDPGDQSDLLNRILPGKYYGHPNPYRNECVFKDGSRQGVSAPANYEAPMWDLGRHKSANGTIEYMSSDDHCGALKGDLIIANYSSGDDLTRVRLSPDGLSVLNTTSLVGGLSNPLPLAEGPDGTIYVGEFGGNLVTPLVPDDIGCWEAKRALPVQMLDVGGAAVGGKLYVVGGKTNSGHLSTLWIYDPASDSWAQGPNLPREPVENPAVTAHDGKIWVFGGSTAPFSGAVANATVYDPSTNAWTVLPSMPEERTGATAQQLNGKIYVVGGMDELGASLASADVFDLTSQTWSSASSMATRRDNPGSAVLDGKLYVFGGRTRNADGGVADGTLNTVEMLNPITGAWEFKSPMPTGRRTMMVGTLNGRAQVMGGEITSTSGAFPNNEEYDPATDTWRVLTSMKTPRHGAAAGTIDGVVYVASGAPKGGFAVSDVTEAFSFPSTP